MRIEGAEHTSFIEGLLFYIAMRLGDKDSLMDFLRAWGKEYEKRIVKEAEVRKRSGGGCND